MHDPGNYRGITLLILVLKLLESVLDARTRRIVESDFGETSRVPEGERNSKSDARPETDGESG